jgi:hypothetical protein
MVGALAPGWCQGQRGSGASVSARAGPGQQRLGSVSAGLLQTLDAEKAVVPIEHTLQLQGRGYNTMHDIYGRLIIISY